MTPLVPALNIGVIGLGTAGMAAGILLAEAGARVTIYEAVEAPSAVGAGILLQPTGLSVLDRLGVADTLIGRGHCIRRLTADTHRGRRLFDLRYGSVDPDLFGLGMHRGTLFTTLYERVRETQVEVELGVSIDDIVADDPASASVFSNGNHVANHDLVVVANGARSALRACPALPPSTAAEYPWGALWYTGPMDPQIPTSTLTQVVRGTERMIGLLPMGRGPDDHEDQVTLYWSARSDQAEAIRHGDLGAWRDEALRDQPLAETLIDRIESLEELLFSTYLDVRMKPWHRGRVVVLGDAAHAMSPQLGQGCNMALLDAAALSTVLADSADVATALARYSAIRKHPVGFYQFANRWCTPWFQSSGRVRGWLRDATFGIASRLPGLHGQMVRTMMGVKRGFIRRSLPLSPLRRALPG